MKARGTELNAMFIKRLGVDFSKIKTFVDLGAHIGTTAYWFAVKAPQAKIIAIEPVIENYLCVLDKMIFPMKYFPEDKDSKVPSDNIVPIFTAVSDHTGKQEIFLAIKGASHSFFEHKRFINNNAQSRMIPTMTWDDLMDSLNITEVDVAKVNIEGAEIALLKGMTKVFPKKMIIEEHERCIRAGYSLDELHKLIKEKGYKILDFNMPRNKLADIYLEYEGKT